MSDVPNARNARQMVLMHKLLPKLKSQGRKVLVFSQARLQGGYKAVTRRLEGGYMAVTRRLQGG